MNCAADSMAARSGSGRRLAHALAPIYRRGLPELLERVTLRLRRDRFGRPIDPADVYTLANDVTAGSAS